MPIYLSRRFYQEHIDEHVSFLSRSSLVVPSSQSENKRFWTLNQENLSEIDRLSPEEIKNDNNFADITFLKDVKSCQTLLKYEASGSVDNNNIIEIDSDSDLDILSSGFSGSSCMKDNIYHESICSMLLKEEDGEIADLLLDELVVEDDFVTKSLLMTPDSMREKLKPVMIKDPFRNNDFHKYHSVVIAKLEEHSVEKIVERDLVVNFSKMEENQLDDKVLDDMSMEVPLDSDSEISVGVLPTFEEPCIKPEDVTQDLVQEDLKKLSSIEDYTLEKFDMTPIEKHDDSCEALVAMPIHLHSNILDSPLSHNDVNDVNDILPDMSSETKQEVTPRRTIFSPSVIKNYEKKFRKEEATYADMLLMLMTVPSMPYKVALPSIDLMFLRDLIHENVTCDELLSWNPIRINSKKLEKIASSLIVPLRKLKNKQPVVSQQDFHAIKIDTTVKEFTVDDWKVKEKKIESLKFLTSYEKPKPGEGIPALKSKRSEAPLGYHSNKVVLRDRPMFNVENLLSETPRRNSFLTSTPQSRKIFESPVDAFIALRTGRLNKQVNRSVAYVQPVTKVSAAKVTPIVNDSLMSKKQAQNPLCNESIASKKIIDENDKSKLNPIKEETPMFHTNVNNRNILDSGFSSSLEFPTSISDQHDVYKSINSSSVELNKNTKNRGMHTTSSTKQTNVKQKEIELFHKDIQYIVNPNVEDRRNSSFSSLSSLNKSPSKKLNWQTDKSNENHSYIKTQQQFRDVDFAINHCPNVNSSNPRTMHDIEMDKNQTQNIQGNCNTLNGMDTNGKLPISKNILQSDSHIIKANNVLKHMKVHVELSVGYKNVIDSIVKESQPLIQFLRDVRRIKPQKNSLADFSVEITSFLVKEEEQKLQQGCSEKDVLCGVVCLDGLTNAIDIIMRSNIESCCQFLQIYGTKYAHILKNCLEPVRKKLLIHVNEVHAGFEKMITSIKEWQNKNNDEMHTLIIIPNNEFSFASSLRNYFSSFGIAANLYPSTDQGEASYSNTFITSSVIIATTGEDLESCPWKFFQFVIQYNIESDKWFQTVKNVHPNLNGFLSITVQKNLDLASNKEISDQTVSANMKHTLLCSKDILHHKDLLIQLESKYNMQILTKDYSVVPINSFQPDILIDERTCVLMMKNEDILSGNLHLEIIELKILSAIMKCLVCHVVVIQDESCLSIPNSSLTQCLSSLVGAIKVSFPDVTCKIWNTVSSNALAQLIMNLSNMAYKANKVWTKEQWTQKNWLSEEISKEECFLMSYPFINSICAQIMMQACESLDVLMKLGLQELKNVFTWIPDHVLEAFYKTNHHKEPEATSEENHQQPFHNSAIAISNEEPEFDNVSNDLSFYNTSVDDYQKQWKPTEPIADIIERENSCTLAATGSSFERSFEENFKLKNHDAAFSFENSNQQINLDQFSSSAHSFVHSSALQHPKKFEFNLNENSSRFGNNHNFNYGSNPILHQLDNSVTNFNNKSKTYNSSNYACLSNRPNTSHSLNNDLLDIQSGLTQDNEKLFETTHQEAFKNKEEIMNRSKRNQWPYEPSKKIQRSFNDYPDNNYSIPPQCQRSIENKIPNEFFNHNQNQYFHHNRSLMSRQMDQSSFHQQRFFNEKKVREDNPSMGHLYQQSNQNSYNNFENKTGGFNNKEYGYSNSRQASYIPQKRRLVFEKVPGATNGQTRLAFV